MSDVVERLRHTYFPDPLTDEAADEIERLRKTAIETMQEMLRRANEIERLQSCLYAQEDVKPLYEEIKRLRAAIAHVRQRSAKACEILNDFDNTRPKPLTKEVD